jgi:diguanylate cyclase (GGDEF)-like protein
VSIGISCFPGDGAAPEALVQAADLAMYQAKRLGRNGFRVYAKSQAKPPRKRGRTAKT